MDTLSNDSSTQIGTNFAPNSRVWIYLSSRPFTTEEAEKLQGALKQFAISWTSHNQLLKAQGVLLHRRFIILMVDESKAGASGCSIDKSVHFIQAVEQQFGVNLFDRLLFAYEVNQEIHTAHKNAFKTLYQEGKINDQTLVFDTLIDNKAAFDLNWTKPLKESWHFRMVQ